MESLPHREALPEEFVRSILSPYEAKGCVYVDEEWIESDLVEGLPPASAIGGAVRGRARFSISTSCYIDDTGHFNAVEFNICYNQIAYVFLAHCARRKLLTGMEEIDLPTYRRLQLPGILISRISSSFRWAIDPRRFEGEVVLDSIEPRRNYWSLETSVRFFDAKEGHAEGQVQLAFLRPDRI